jgi:hypothetical protein
VRDARSEPLHKRLATRDALAEGARQVLAGLPLAREDLAQVAHGGRHTRSVSTLVSTNVIFQREQARFAVYAKPT